MEKENLRGKQLTSSSGSFYSRSMDGPSNPENGDVNSNVPEDIISKEDWRNELSRLKDQPDLEATVRRAVDRQLEELTEDDKKVEDRLEGENNVSNEPVPEIPPALTSGGEGDGGPPDIEPLPDSPDGDDDGNGSDNKNPFKERKRPKEDAVFQEKLLNLLGKKDVAELLKSDDPDFYQVGREVKSQDISELVEFIQGIDTSETDIVTFANIITRETIPLKDGGTIELSPASRKLLFEWALERVISLPDKSPDARYSIGGGYMVQNNLDRLRTLSISAFNPNEAEFRGFAENMATLIEVRQAFHELRRFLPQKEEYLKYILGELRTHGLHFVNNEMVGVSQVLTQLERKYFFGVSQSNEWLPDRTSDEIEKEVVTTINQMWESGQLKDGERPLTAWEKDRAIRFGTTFFAGLQRKAVAVGVGNIPTETTKRYGSRPNEYIFRTLYAVKSIGVRFHGVAPGGRELLKRVLKYKNRIEEKSSVKTKSLLGVSQETMMVNQWGAPDIQSHSWRGQLLFLSAVRFRGEGTLLEAFNNAANQERLRINPQTGKFEYGESHPLYGSDKEPDISNVEDAIREKILGQRLYLSVLAQQELSPMLKTRIWQKRAILDPLAIVTLRPEILSSLNEDERKLLGEIRPMLDIAHGIRVQQEKERYEEGLTEDFIETEANAYQFDPKSDDLPLVSEDIRYQLLNDKYLQQELLANPDIAPLMKKVIDLSYGEASYLATAIFPHNYILDDTPFVAWADTGEGSGLGEENMYRGFGDQKTLQESGWAPIINLIQKPTLGASGEIFDKSFAEGLGQIHSPNGARVLLKPIELGWLDMASQYSRSLKFGILEKEREVPRSPMEKYFPKSFIAFDERDKVLWLDGRSQNGSAPINTKELNEAKKEVGAARKNTFIKGLRELLQLLPAAFVFQFLKSLGIEFREAAKEAQGS